MARRDTGAEQSDSRAWGNAGRKRSAGRRFRPAMRAGTGKLAGGRSPLSVELERPAVGLGFEARIRGVLKDLMQLQHIRLRVGVLGEGSGASVTLLELFGADPVEQVLPALPEGENDIGLAVVDGAQHVVRNKAGHAVHKAGPLAERRFECVV